MKLCSKCKIIKSFIYFYKNRTRKDGFDNQCKNCKIPYRKEHHKRNKEKDNKNSTIWNNKNRNKKWYLKNRDKILQKQKIWLMNNPEKRRQFILKKYNITLDGYNKLLIKQNNKCAICNEFEIAIDKRTNKIKNLSVDHNHITKIVRGLLCTRCNTLIGLARESEEILNKSIEYLRIKKSIMNDIT